MKLKRNSGIMIRLVDVVLILLFGFLLIAKIQQQVDIALPQSNGDNPPPVEKEKDFEVWVFFNGSIRIGRDASIEIAKIPLTDSDGVSRKVEYELARGFIDRMNKNDKTVIINSQREAPVQYTVDLIDICNELDMKMAIRCFEPMGQKTPELPTVQAGG